MSGGLYAVNVNVFAGRTASRGKIIRFHSKFV